MSLLGILQAKAEVDEEAIMARVEETNSGRCSLSKFNVGNGMADHQSRLVCLPTTRRVVDRLRHADTKIPILLAIDVQL